jgi:hypothetical protein
MVLNQFEAAQYVREIAVELAKHACRNGLYTMAFCLEMAVAEADEIANGFQAKPQVA